MKNKTMKLLVLSCSVCISSVGLSSFVIGDIINNKYVAKNNIGDEPVAKILGKDELYSSVEKALDVAQSGDIVTLLPPTDANYPAIASPDKVTYTIKRDCIVKPGVTLLIPTDSNSLVSAEANLDNYIKSMEEDDHSGNASDYKKFATENDSRYLRVTLHINDNVTVKNFGNIIVSGYLGGGGVNPDLGCIGQTYGSYSRIVLGKNAKIIQKTDSYYDASASNLYCYGYITEKSKDNSSLVDIANGNLYLPFIVNDYRGFQLSWSMTAKDGALDKGSSPFNQFEFRNIDSTMKISYNANAFGIVNAYMEYDAYSIKQNFTRVLNIVGDTSDFVFQLFENKTVNDQSYLIYKYDRDKNTADIDFFGGFKFNNLEIVFEANAFGVSASVVLSTTKSFFPLSYKFNISLNKLKSQTTCSYDFTTQKIKILPGCTVTVNQYCAVEASEIVVYDAFFDGSNGNGPGTACMYNDVKYPQLNGGTLIVDSASTIKATAIAGTVYCDNPENLTVNEDVICSLEPWQCKNNPNFDITSAMTTKEPAWTISDYLFINEKLKIVSLDSIEKKKIFVGINCFDLDFTPSIDVIVTHTDGSQEIKTVDTYQETLFFDDIVSYKLDFKKDISKVYKHNQYYNKGDVIAYDETKPSVILINSSVSISSDANGINEFNAQSIDIECLTEPIDGVIPLFPDKTIALAANVVDLNKIYNKTIKWESLTPNTASVDSSGIVRGISLGKVIIQASCDGMFTTFETNVIDESSIEIPTLTNAVIFEKESHKEGSFNIKTDETVRFTFQVEILETGAPITDITWEISGDNVPAYHNLIDPITNEIATSKKVSGMYKEITVEFSGPGTLPDDIVLTCTVSNATNKVVGTMNIKVSEPTCLLGGTKVLLWNGTYKLAKNLKSGDAIMTFNHFTGKFEPRKILVNAILEGNFDIIKLEFDNGCTLSVASGHGLFNLTNNKYEIYYARQFYEHIGEEFVVISNSNGNLSLSSAKLLKVSMKVEKTKKYSPVSEYNINCIADGVLTIPDDIEGMFDSFEFLPINDDLKINVEKFESLIKKYGIYSYSEVENIIPNYLYNVLNFKYFKTFIGAGFLSVDKINYWIKKYAKMMCEYNNVEWDFNNSEQLK